MAADDDPTRIERARRPIEPHWPAPAYGAITFHQVATNGGALCVECRACERRIALTKNECSHIRTGNSRYVLHVSFKCTRCGADHPRLWRATLEQAKMFLAGDRVPAEQQIGRSQ